ncbi:MULTISPECIES: C1 family peptidase [Lysinibacillus]|nr:C1 family peptidase [Lysinibacillus capsici]MCT1538520.1 C1 family peptidase [Lysinibacillus capsici]MCT1569228.1 C1 family peptidase [Lysinibacillus capsici]MCT1646243.1 C1 family peptidase [Lysinibacillus capsici]MCT1725251.1 C1 family peptidase [Lysinibacillus capsici]MCT1784031.1 C1 family peptidase [Lysinibacillus capsici]
MIMSDKYNLMVDLRNNFSIVRDQGSRGTCTAFAVTACHEHHRNLDVRLSEEYVFSSAKHLDGKDDSNGISIPSAFKAIQSYGHSKDSIFPYNQHLKTPFKFADIDTNVKKDALGRKISSYQFINADVQEIENHLSMERPVITGVEVQPTFWLSNENVFIDVPQVETFEGLHAILIMGYGQRDDGKNFFIIRNSWGPEWADNGYAYVSYDYFNKYNRGAWIIPKGA